MSNDKEFMQAFFDKAVWTSTIRASNKGRYMNQLTLG
jgi:hypothetical protein